MLPIILLGVMIAAGWISPYLPLSFNSVVYSLSLSIKSVIVFLLPLLIFCLLFKTAVHLAKTATRMMVFLIVGVCVSNFISTLVSYGVGTWIYDLDFSMVLPDRLDQLTPAWTLQLPTWIRNDYALFGGVVLGIVLAKFKPKAAHRIAQVMEKAIRGILNVFLVLIPLFIAGFVIKLSHDRVLSYMLSNYALILGIVAGAVLLYVMLIYFLANRLQWKNFIRCLHNMLPAALTGLGSMSSAAAMPMTIVGTEKNSQDPTLARAVIPATVNIHLIGDCFAIPIFAFAILKTFGVAEPTFFAYLGFACYFVLAKFSVAAVPGGGILVMLPILEKQLGFNAEMLSLITALYVLFDPIITCANVLGNGGFALGMSRLVQSKNARLTRQLPLT